MGRLNLKEVVDRYNAAKAEQIKERNLKELDESKFYEERNKVNLKLREKQAKKDKRKVEDERFITKKDVKHKFGVVEETNHADSKPEGPFDGTENVRQLDFSQVKLRFDNNQELNSYFVLSDHGTMNQVIVYNTNKWNFSCSGRLVGPKREYTQIVAGRDQACIVKGVLIMTYNDYRDALPLPGDMAACFTEHVRDRIDEINQRRTVNSNTPGAPALELIDKSDVDVFNTCVAGHFVYSVLIGSSNTEVAHPVLKTGGEKGANKNDLILGLICMHATTAELLNTSFVSSTRFGVKVTRLTSYVPEWLDIADYMADQAATDTHMITQSPNETIIPFSSITTNFKNDETRI